MNMYIAHALAWLFANGVYGMPRPSGTGWPGHRHTGDDWGMDTDSRDTIIRELREENASPWPGRSRRATARRP